MSSPRRRLMLTIAAALGGLVLFAFAVRRAGAAEILEAVRRVGWGLVPILALGGLRFAVRAEAWRLCMPQASRLSRPDAFQAFLAGDAVGNTTPFGLFASEPAKVFLTRQRLATREAVESLAVDNLVYVFSILAMVALGVAVLLATVPLSFEWQGIGLAALAALLVAGLAGAFAVRGWWGSRDERRPPWRERLATLRQSVLERTAGSPVRLWRVFVLDLLFHGLAVLEAYLTLGWLLADRAPTVSEAIVFESLSRVVTVVFKFVPFRIGVDETASGALAALLAISASVGVALAVVRKVRNLCWAGAGLAIIAVHHGRGARATDPRESAPARRI